MPYQPTAEELAGHKGPEITKDQNDRIKELAGIHGLASGIFQPEGIGPYGDLVMVWPTFGVVIHPDASFTQMKRVA